MLDAAGLALFCVTGASTALDHRLGTVEAVVLGAITGVGGGVLRDILVREIPVVLRGGPVRDPRAHRRRDRRRRVQERHPQPRVPDRRRRRLLPIRLAGVYFDLNVPRALGPGDRDAR